jgi:hypothetical protein
MSGTRAGLPTRREFTRRITTLALAAPAAACGMGLPAAPSPIPVPHHPLPGLPPEGPARADATQAEDAVEAEAALLLRLAHARYGRHLDPAQLEAVRRGIASGLRAAERLRRVPLRNRDEPDFTFAAYRREG